ncbi:MAG TPA: ABC transporter substrate-binding protein [Candidatus Tectomicrobia bacterium]
MAILLAMTGLLLSACGGTPPVKTYTIGVVNYVSVLEAVLEGFKTRMAELGYVEGQNITYIYHGVLAADSEVIKREVQSLLDQKVDLFLTLGTLPTLAAKHAVEATNIPVVFAPVINPVEEGIVQSITHPGGNVTGVQNGNTIPKALEWLHKIVPQVSKIYVFYHPQDRVALTSVKTFPEIAAALGFELILDEVQSRQEAIAAIQRLPKDAAIFLAPAPRLEPLAAMIEAAVAHGTAVAAQNPRYIQGGVLVAYAPDPSAIGKQAARLADQIFKGTRPADLPVETAEYFLNINLQSANLIGLHIPDEILRQAKSVIR